MLNAHDFCSPSQLDLRYSCPGSVRLQRNLIGTGEAAATDYATEGTKKHDQVREWRGKPGSPAEVPDDVVWVIGKVIELTEKYSTIPEAIILDEYQIDLSDLGISGGTEGCRVDLLIVVPGRKAVLIDYKFGVMYVPRPKYNWQMKAYSAGIFRSYGVSEIEVLILQPNTSEEFMVKTDFFYAPEIKEFESQIKEIVEKTKREDAPLVRGAHCSYGFCRSRGICPLWRDAYLSMPTHMTVAAHLKNIGPEQRRELYENLVAAETWCKKARATAEMMAINKDIDIDGYEVAPGRKTRVWGRDEEEVAGILITLMRNLSKQTEVWTLKSPAEIESAIGKSKLVKDTITPLIVFKEGNPCLKKKGLEQ